MSVTVRIGTVNLAVPLVTAPMAGYTDKVYRRLAKESGAALTYTEMISAQGLIYENKNTWSLLNLKDEPGPVAVQLFGSRPEVLAAAAGIAVEAGAAIVDLNMGCPTPKIVKNGEGAALMQDISLAAAIVNAMAKAAEPVPVTVKMRKGWDEQSLNVVAVARAVADAGAAAVAIHGRTRSQFYRGQADWGCIRQVKAAISVPVIGNGDIKEKEDAAAMLAETGCDAVMIGRAAIGNPWLLKNIYNQMKDCPQEFEPDAGTKVAMALRHLRLLIELKGEAKAVKQMRKYLAYYLRGLPGAARCRQRLYALTTEAEIKTCLHNYLLTIGSGA